MLIHRNLVKKTDLESLKSDFDRLDIDKLQTTPFDLNKVNDVIKNEFVKKTVYDELVKDVNAVYIIDTSSLIKKAQKLMKIAQKLHKYWWNWKIINNHDHGKYITTQ